MSAHIFFSLVAVSISTGADYALFALGYALVYSVLRLMNMAHGDVMMAATFLSLLIFEVTHSIPLTIIGGVIAGALVGIAVDQIAYRPLRFTGDSIAPLVTGLGAAYIIRNAISSTYGEAVRGYPQVVGLGEVHVGAVIIPVGSLIVIVVCLLGAVRFRRVLDRRRTGWLVRAVSEDLTAARLVGLPIGTILIGVYAVSGIAAAIGGIYYSSTVLSLNQTMGWNATTIAFTAAILGGLGSLSGSVIGGLVIGFADTFVAYLLPNAYEQAVSFGLLFIVIMARPARHRDLSVVDRA